MKQKRTTAASPSGEVMVYSLQTKHLFTEEEQVFFEKAEKNELFSPKYLKKQQEKAVRLTRGLFESNPEQPLKLVMIAILNTFPDYLPPRHLMEVVTHVAQEWMQLKNEAVQA